MNAVDPNLLVLTGLLVLVAAAAAIAVLRVIRRRRRSRRRLVEKPNSHYTSQLVRENDTRHRWHDIALDRIHEINREEVVRLLAKLEATGVEALSPKERVFLDGMAELAGTRPAAEPPGQARSVPPTLRHRPA